MTVAELRRLLEKFTGTDLDNQQVECRVDVGAEYRATLINGLALYGTFTDKHDDRWLKVEGRHGEG